MREVTKGKLLLACSTCLLLGYMGGSHESRLSADLEPAREKAPPALPTKNRIGASIYMQTSAEYRACCLGIYRCAESRLAKILKAARPKPQKPAVVMDLDETVLDNSAFWTFLHKNPNLVYTKDLWADYELNHLQDVRLVPGTKKFIDQAMHLGVAVVFISNGFEEYRRSTEDALERLEINVTKAGGRLYLKPKDGSDDKASRRELAAAQYNVLMYFGDSLRDFSESFAVKLPERPTIEDYLKGISERKLAVDKAECHWGVDWFVLPNPVYGEWDKLIGSHPKAIMRPTSMKRQPRR